MRRFYLLVYFFVAVSLPGFFFSPGASLKVISTRYFDIVFSENTASSAGHLAVAADRIYENVAGLLFSNLDVRIPVVLSDLEGDANGFSTLYPYTKIVLYDVPPDPEGSLGNTGDYLLAVFTHELVHAVSLNIRGPFWRFFQPVLGDYYTSPNINWMMPLQMIEGVAVSYESREGFGRLNDPFIHQYLLQASLEDRFLTPDAASGALDRFPFASAYYYYGGFFSRYLQDVYSMEAYADLWHEAGRGWIIPGFTGAFRQTYGKGLKEEWNTFADTFQVPWDVCGDVTRLTGRSDYIAAMTGRKNLLYYISAYENAVRVFDTVSGKDRQLLSLSNASSASLDLSVDGERLVISLLENTEDGTRRVVREYDTLRNVYTDLVIPDMRKASAVSDGIAGVLVEGNRTCLALHRNGKTVKILTGREGAVFSSVKELEPGLFVFLAALDGRRDLFLFSLADGRVRKLLLPLDADFFPRDLGLGEGFFFSFNDDFSFYRLGVIRDDRFLRQTRRVSGGVFYPVFLDSRLYYAGLFSDGWYLAVEPYGEEGLEDAGEVRYEESADFFLPGEEKAKRPLTGNAEVRNYNPLANLVPRMVLPYVSSGSVIVDDDGNILLSGFESFGLKTFTVDPAEGNEVTAYSGYVWCLPFADAGIEWKNTALPVGFSVGASDSLQYSDEPGAAYRRSAIKAGFSAKKEDPVSGLRYGFSGSGRTTFSAAETSGDGPYAWKYTGRNHTGLLSGSAGIHCPDRFDLELSVLGSLVAHGDVAGLLSLSRFIQATVQAERSFPGYLEAACSLGGVREFDPLPLLELNATLGLGNFHSRYPGFLDYGGITLNTYMDYRFVEAMWKAGGGLIAAPPGFPFCLRVYGALSSEDVFSTNGARGFRSSAGYPVFTEFFDRGPVSRYYTGGDAELGLFNLEVQRRVWIVPLFLNRINLSTGYRALWNGGLFYHSAFARCGMTFSPLIGASSRIHFSIRLEGVYSFTDREFSFSLF